MKQFKVVSFSKQQARRELKDFRALLNDPAKPELKEREDILPFFTAHEQLIALTGMYNPLIANLDRIATEFDIFGDHTADVAVGDSQSHQYCFIEFEDAASNSVFRKKGNKATLEWSDRFDHGCSQIIDWLLWLENQKHTQPYLQRFGVNEVQYVGLLVVGRDKFLSDPALRQRLTWRSEQVVVCSRKLHCITFDKLYRDMDLRLKSLSRG
jgi:Domain of unknown function (DUF4263)